MIYLASPYTHSNKDIELERYADVSLVCARFARLGEHVYSPIATWHPIALAHKMPTDSGYYRSMNEAMIRVCDQFFVLMLDGWFRSKGVQAEIDYAESIGSVPQYITIHHDGTIYNSKGVQYQPRR